MRIRSRFLPTVSSGPNTSPAFAAFSNLVQFRLQINNYYSQCFSVVLVRITVVLSVALRITLKYGYGRTDGTCLGFSVKAIAWKMP